MTNDTVIERVLGLAAPPDRGLAGDHRRGRAGLLARHGRELPGRGGSRRLAGLARRALRAAGGDGEAGASDRLALGTGCRSCRRAPPPVACGPGPRPDRQGQRIGPERASHGHRVVRGPRRHRRTWSHLSGRGRGPRPNGAPLRQGAPRSLWRCRRADLHLRRHAHRRLGRGRRGGGRAAREQQQHQEHRQDRVVTRVHVHAAMLRPRRTAAPRGPQGIRRAPDRLGRPGAPRERDPTWPRPRRSQRCRP